MVRGSAFSAAIHVTLLAAALFGLPQLRFLLPDDALAPSAPAPSGTSQPAQPPEPPMRVTAVTPEQNAEIARAASRPLEQFIEPEGKRRGLMVDVPNAESPDEQTPILQAKVEAPTPRRPDPALRDEPSRPQPVATRREPSPDRGVPEPSEHVVERPDARAVERTAPPPPERSISAPARFIQPQQEQTAHAPTPPVPSTQSALLTPDTAAVIAPASRPAAQVAAATPSVQQVAMATSAQAAPQWDGPAEERAAAPSAAARLAAASPVARALAPLLSAMPRLDSTMGEILAARERSPSQASPGLGPAFEKSLARMGQLAEQGYAHAQFNLAEIHLSGNGVPRDMDKGKEYLLRAGMNGYLPAQVLMAALAMEGSVLPRDLGEAHAWLSVAAETSVAKTGSARVVETRAALEKQMQVRDVIRAKQRRAQLRQILVVLSRPTDAKPNAKPSDDQLRVAAALGDVEAVHVLLAQGADVDAPDEDGRTASIEASWRGYVKILNGLIEHGADIHVTDGSGKNALMWASINGHSAVVQRLLDADMPIDAQDQEGATALIRAAWNGHADVVRLLLQRKADPRLRDRSGKTALDYAVKEGYQGIARLLQAGARS